MAKPVRLMILSALLVVALLMAACAPAEPELGTAENPIIVSFVPSDDAAAVLASATAITDVLSERTGLVIQAEVPTSFVGSIEAMCAGEAHVGTLNTFSYIVANQRECANIALVSTRFGSATYGGQVITRTDSGIAGIEDLAGATFCRPDAFSTSGWIIPSISLRAAGIDPDTDLGEVVDSGGHSGVVRAVYAGDCDAGATFVDARTGVQEELADVMDVTTVILESPAIPNDGVSFIPSVPEEIRAAITQAFLDMAADPEDAVLLQELYSWEGFEQVDNSFYDAFRQVLEGAGVDVESFLEG